MTSLQQLTADIHRLIPVMATMGVEIVEADGGTVAARIPAAPNANHFGSVYAGSLFTVAEVLGGVLSYAGLAAEGAVPLVKSLTIDFLRPAGTAVVARAGLSDAELQDTLARYEAHGKADFDLITEVTDEAGTVVARTRGLYQLRRF